MQAVNATIEIAAQENSAIQITRYMPSGFSKVTFLFFKLIKSSLTNLAL